MKSSNCSLTFSGMAGAFPGWLLGERGLIQAPRELYRHSQVGQLGLRRSLPICCLALHPSKHWVLRDLNLTQAWGGIQKLGNRDSWESKSGNLKLGIQKSGGNPKVRKNQGLLLSTPWGCKVWRSFPQVPHLNIFLSSLPHFPAN